MRTEFNTALWLLKYPGSFTLRLLLFLDHKSRTMRNWCNRRLRTEELSSLASSLILGAMIKMNANLNLKIQVF